MKIFLIHRNFRTSLFLTIVGSDPFFLTCLTSILSILKKVQIGFMFVTFQKVPVYLTRDFWMSKNGRKLLLSKKISFSNTFLLLSTLILKIPGRTHWKRLYELSNLKITQLRKSSNYVLHKIGTNGFEIIKLRFWSLVFNRILQNNKTREIFKFYKCSQKYFIHFAKNDKNMYVQVNFSYYLKITSLQSLEADYVSHKLLKIAFSIRTLRFQFHFFKEIGQLKSANWFTMGELNLV